jgi:hypothetical protein
VRNDLEGKGWNLARDLSLAIQKERGSSVKRCQGHQIVALYSTSRKATAQVTGPADSRAIDEAIHTTADRVMGEQERAEF